MNWHELVSLASVPRLMLPLSNQVALRKLLGGQWRLDLSLPADESGLFHLSIGWNGEWMEHRWLESSDGLLQWGWLCPRQPVDARGDKCLHCLDWQLLHQKSGEQPAGAILIWADPQFAPSGLDPQVCAWCHLLRRPPT